jgi:fluoride exporter
MPCVSLFVVDSGAALGAWARWGLSLLLNPVFPTLPLGTLTANLLAGFIIGIVMSVADPQYGWAMSSKIGRSVL